MTKTYRVTCPACKKSFQLPLEELHPGTEHLCTHCGATVVLASGDIPKAAHLRKAKILADISKVLNK
jgi:rRNA maturation endonuclease Nob1